MNQPEQSAAAFFLSLGRLLGETAVSDRQGRALSLDQGMQRAVELILATAAAGGKTMIIGNGGSAAIASHLHNDLGRAVVRSLALCDLPMLTALANDHGYGCVFARQIEVWSEPDDLLVAISSSGRSDNILRAVKAARGRGCRVLTLSGFGPDNPLRGQGDLNFYVAAQDYGRVESAHAVLAHYLSDAALAARGVEPA